MFGIENFSEPIIDFSNFEFSQLSDALLFGGAVMLIGMLTIFSVLCILWICLILFRLFFHDLPKRRSEKKLKSDVALISENKTEIQATSDDELIAVIAAAVAMAESDETGIKFRVVSFKRV